MPDKCAGGWARLEKPIALKNARVVRGVLTNFWRILYAHSGIVPNFNCSVSYSFPLARTPRAALFPGRWFADSFFAPQIARVVYVAGPPAPRRAIQPLFCLAVVASVCPVSSRLAQSAWMVIKSALPSTLGVPGTAHNNNARRRTRESDTTRVHSRNKPPHATNNSQLFFMPSSPIDRR